MNKTGQTKKLLKVLNNNPCCDELSCEEIQACVQPDITNIYNILNQITNISNFLDGTYLIDGGQRVWIEDYDFNVSAANYKILGDQFHSDETLVTLSPADPVLDRIDVIAVDVNGNVVVIEGVPNANPEKPYVDPETQLELTFVTVFANTTEPPAATSNLIYNENLGVGGGEWNGTSSHSSLVLNSGVSPKQGLLSIESTNAIVGANLVFDKTSDLSADSNMVLVMYIKSKGTWGNISSGKKLNISFLNSANQVIGSNVLVSSSGTYGFNSSLTTGYQQVAIPLKDFGIVSGDAIRKVRIAITGNTGTIGFYMDVVSINFVEIIPVTGGILTDANNGTSLSGTTVQLGQDVGGSGATLLNHREIPMANFTLTFLADAAQSNNMVAWKNSASAIRARVTSAADFSNNGGQASAEKFGQGAVVSGVNGIAFGNAAVATNGITIGTGSSGGGNASIVIGNGLNLAARTNIVAIGGFATGNNCVAIGDSSSAGSSSIAIGVSALASSTGAVAIGTNCQATGQNATGINGNALHTTSCAIGGTTTGVGQFVLGAEFNAFSDMYLGAGVLSATAGLNTFIIHSTGGLGTDKAGMPFAIAAGKGTGNAVGGSLLFQTSTIGASGSTLQTLSTKLTIDHLGIFTLNQGLGNYANDAAAAVGLVPVNGLYRNGSVVMIRVS